MRKMKTTMTEFLSTPSVKLCQIQRARSVAIHRNIPACSLSAWHICISPFGSSGDWNTRLQNPGLLSSTTAHSQPKACWWAQNGATLGLETWPLLGHHHHMQMNPTRGQESVPGYRAWKDQPHASTNKPNLTAATKVLQKNWCCLMNLFYTKGKEKEITGVIGMKTSCSLFWSGFLLKGLCWKWKTIEKRSKTEDMQRPVSQALERRNGHCVIFLYLKRRLHILFWYSLPGKINI